MPGIYVVEVQLDHHASAPTTEAGAVHEFVSLPVHPISLVWPQRERMCLVLQCPKCHVRVWVISIRVLPSQRRRGEDIGMQN